MAQWHVNPATGEAGRCSAAYSCPFGGELSGHKATKKEASALYETFRSGLHDPEKASYFYFISEEDNEAFTWGDCGLLARELNKRSGYPVNAIGIRTKGSDQIAWEHIAVKAPDGRFLDVTGIQPEESLREAWNSHLSLSNEEIVISEIDEKEIETYLRRSNKDSMYPNSNPRTTAVKVLNALKEEF